jgi:spore coat protein CotH
MKADKAAAGSGAAVLAASLLVSAQLGCGPGPDSAETDDASTDESGETGDGDGDPCAAGAVVLDEEVVHDLRIELSDADWAAMIQEAEDSPEYDGPPKTYFRADVWLDDVQVESVGVRLKGHYSLLTAIDHSFPLKLDFDRYVAGQKFDGLKKLNLHPNGEEDSSPREYLSYGALRAYGLPTARTSFTFVTLNGEELGLYNSVEQIGGGFITCHFDEPRGDLYKPEEPGGTLLYEGDTIENYPTANHKWPDQTDHASFLEMVDTVNHRPVDEFEEVLDVPGVLEYLAGNVAVGNFDYYASYGHNYYLYENTPGRFTMLPWDMNLSQIEFWHPCGSGRNSDEWPVSHHLLGDEGYTAQYGAIMADMLQGPMSVQALNDRLDRAMELVGDSVSADIEDDLRFAIEYRVDMLSDGLADLTTCPIETE